MCSTQKIIESLLNEKALMIHPFKLLRRKDKLSAMRNPGKDIQAEIRAINLFLSVVKSETYENRKLENSIKENET